MIVAPNGRIMAKLAAEFYTEREKFWLEQVARWDELTLIQTANRQRNIRVTPLWRAQDRAWRERDVARNLAAGDAEAKFEGRTYAGGGR